MSFPDLMSGYKWMSVSIYEHNFASWTVIVKIWLGFQSNEDGRQIRINQQQQQQ